MLKNSSEIIHESWSVYKKNWKTLIPFMVILFVPKNLIMPVMGTLFLYLETFLPGSFMVNNVIILLIATAVAVLSIWTSIALAKTLYALTNGKIIPWKESFSVSLNLIGPIFSSSILVFFIVLGGALLFVIPGIIFMVWYSFYFFAVAFENQRGFAALKASKALVVGRWWTIIIRLFLPALLFAVIYIVITFIPLSLIGLVPLPKFLESIFFNLTTSIISSIMAPLLSLAAVILYQSAKQNPATSSEQTPPTIQ
jgi:hypothetical protein